MPSQINNPGNVVNVTANYLKTAPSTRFATRQLAFMKISVVGIQNNWDEPNSLFTQVVRGVQLVAEIYAVGTPNSGVVTVVVAADTNASQDQLNGMAQSLSTQFGSQGITATVNAVGLYGGSLLSIGDFNDAGGDLRPPYENEHVGQYD